jgi:hypothetical protein
MAWRRFLVFVAGCKRSWRWRNPSARADRCGRRAARLKAKNLRACPFPALPPPFGVLLPPAAAPPAPPPALVLTHTFDKQLSPAPHVLLALQAQCSSPAVQESLLVLPQLTTEASAFSKNIEAAQ